MRKKITEQVTVELDYEITEKGIICYNHKTFKYFWGSNAVPTYLNGIENIKKKNDWGREKIIGWLIPKWLLIERRDMFKSKLEKYQSNIDMIDKVMKNEMSKVQK